MLQSLKSRWVVTIVVTVLGLLYVSPNFIKLDKGHFLEKSKMTLGLDIQGGLHLVMGVDVKSYLREQTAITARELQSRFKDDGINAQSITVAGEEKNRIEAVFASAKDKDAALKFINDFRASELQVLSSTENKVEIKFFDAVILDREKQVIQQAIEVIRNRIDEFGVAEPSITAQGVDRILVQLPGVKDAVRAKELINQTAKLDFMVVDVGFPQDKLDELIAGAEKLGGYSLGADKKNLAGVAAAGTAAEKNETDNAGGEKETAAATAQKSDKKILTQTQGLPYSEYVKRLNADIQKELPKDTRVVFEKADNATSLEVGRRAYLVKTDTKLNGAELDDARVTPDEFGKPEVSFRFKPEGRRLFADLTSKAAGGLLAIVLDDVVKSAPRVERMIDSESARITLGSSRDPQQTLNEATFIATSLRAGALPAALEQLEERTVGPSLGSDSIAKGEKAGVIGIGLVFLFMLLYYRGAGLIADLTLLLNIILTFAVLSSLGATLTLPGIAGIALTVGMAVDANVIIYERIKEELRKGATAIGALKDGFANAFTSIFDSNLTTVLTCLALMYYGTGPVRGFAVSLSVGITVSMFTAIFVTRLIIETLATMNINVFSTKQVK